MSVNQLAEWRRLVIETYLAEHRIADAETALQRYRQDTPTPDAEDEQLTARVWLAEGRAAEAAELLAEKKDPELRVWGLLADLRSQRRSPETVRAQAQAFIHAAGTPRDAQRRLWAVAAEAARASGDEMAHIEALEQAVGLGRESFADAGLLNANADVLWEAYRHFGMQLAQRGQLVFEDYSPWFDIEERLRARKPLEARALMAVLILRDPAQPLAAEAHARFASSLEESGRGFVLEALYLRSKHMPGPDAVPPMVRYELAKVSLDRGDAPAAMRWMNNLPPPPLDGREAAMWQLARARVLLGAGSVELGAGALETVVRQAKDLDLAERRSALRAVGAVQALGRHQLAIGLLQQLAAATPEMDLQRELQFWIGHSYEALGDYQRAALSYLRTAYLAGDEGADDDWGQRGRYHAAVALAREGLAGDARRLYAGLSDADTEPGLRALALRALDQLQAAR